MRVLVACEFSQVVCSAFRKKGHEAFSCDILPCEGGHPEWHIQDDVLRRLEDGWDLMIAHPPCTYLCLAGAQYLKTDKNRFDKMRKAVKFFERLLFAPIPKICIENPIPHKTARLIEYTQIVRMWQFGHSEAHKPTCLWIKGLPLLIPTKIVRPLKSRRYPNGKVLSQWRRFNGTAHKRSVTFQGIADAMAEQWGT